MTNYQPFDMVSYRIHTQEIDIATGERTVSDTLYSGKCHFSELLEKLADVLPDPSEVEEETEIIYRLSVNEEVDTLHVEHWLKRDAGEEFHWSND